MQNETVCKIQSVGIDNFIRCLEDDPSTCPFSVSLGSAYFCQKPLHVICHEQVSSRTTPVPDLENHREGGRIAV
jgi:hypothetical protein